MPPLCLDASPRNISFSWHPFPWCLHFLLIRFALDISLLLAAWHTFSSWQHLSGFTAVSWRFFPLAQFSWHFLLSHPLPVDKCFSWHLCTLFSRDPFVLKKTGSFWRLFPWPAFPWTTFSRHPLPLEPMFPERKLLHTDAFKKLYIQKPWLAERFYTEKFVCTRAFTHRCFCTEKLLHAGACTRKRLAHTESFYTQKLLRTGNFYTQKAFTCRKLSHTEACTQSCSCTQQAPSCTRRSLSALKAFAQTLLQRFFTHRELLHTGASTRRHTHKQTHAKLLHTEALTQGKITHRSLHTHRKLLHTEAFMHTKVLHPDVFAHRQRLRREGFYTTKAFAHRSFDTQTLFHTQSFHFTLRSFYTDKLLHSHRHFYVQMLLHGRSCTDKCVHAGSFYTEKVLHREAFTCRSLYTQKVLQAKAFDNRNCRPKTGISAPKAKKGTILKPFVEWTLQGHWWAPRTKKKQHFKIISATLTRPAKTIYDGQLQNTTERNLDAAINPRSPSPQSWPTWLQLWHGRDASSTLDRKLRRPRKPGPMQFLTPSTTNLTRQRGRYLQSIANHNELHHPPPKSRTWLRTVQCKPQPSIIKPDGTAQSDIPSHWPSFKFRMGDVAGAHSIASRANRTRRTNQVPHIDAGTQGVRKNIRLGAVPKLQP